MTMSSLEVFKLAKFPFTLERKHISEVGHSAGSKHVLKTIKHLDRMPLNPKLYSKQLVVSFPAVRKNSSHRIKV